MNFCYIILKYITLGGIIETGLWNILKSEKVRLLFKQAIRVQAQERPWVRDLHFSWNNGGTTACTSHRRCNIWTLTTEVEISELIHLKSLGKEADIRLLQSERFGVLKLKHLKETQLLEDMYHHSSNCIFTFLFIFKLLTLAFLRNCSKFYMQDGLVSESLASKLHFRDPALGFCLASYKIPFIHLHLGPSTDEETTWLHADTPAAAHWSEWHSQGKRGRVLLQRHPELTAVSGDTSMFNSTDKISPNGRSHTSPLPSDATFLFHCQSTWSCTHHPAPAPVFISLIFTAR